MKIKLIYHNKKKLMIKNKNNKKNYKAIKLNDNKIFLIIKCILRLTTFIFYNKNHH